MRSKITWIAHTQRRISLMSEAVAISDSEAPVLTIEREFAHSPDKVFAAWTDQNALRQWMGPGDVRAPDAEMVAEVGGTYVIPMLLPDGSKKIVRGTISELVRDRRLRFSWAWDQEDGTAGQLMDVLIEFEATDTGTRLVLRQTNFIDVEARDSHNHGWTGSLDKLGAYLAT